MRRREEKKKRKGEKEQEEGRAELGQLRVTLTCSEFCANLWREFAKPISRGSPKSQCGIDKKLILHFRLWQNFDSPEGGGGMGFIEGGFDWSNLIRP